MTTDYREREKRERAVGDNSCSINRFNRNAYVMESDK